MKHFAASFNWKAFHSLAVFGGDFCAKFNQTGALDHDKKETEPVKRSLS